MADLLETVDLHTEQIGAITHKVGRMEVDLYGDGRHNEGHIANTRRWQDGTDQKIDRLLILNVAVLMVLALFGASVYLLYTAVMGLL